MANPVLLIRVAANLSDLKANISEGKAQFEALGDAVKKLAKSYDGSALIQAAQNTVAAVDRIGGVTKLTTEEAKKYNDVLDKAIAKATALGNTAQAEMFKAAKAATDATKPTDSLTTSYLKMTASFVSGEAIIGAAKEGFGFFVDAIKESITAANEAEHAHAQVTAALRAQGQATPAVVDAYGAYATALQKTTIYQDDALEGAEALLVQVGNVMPRDMQKALDAVTNLASGMNIDLTTAAQNVAKAAEGNVGSLRKMGVEVDASKVKAQGFGVVLDAINEKFAGQAAAIAGTYEGRLTQLANTWNNVQESVGRAITTNQTVLDLINSINGTIDVNTKELNQNAAVNQAVSEAVILSVRAFAELAHAIDLVQTGGSGFMITLRNMGGAIGNIGVMAIESGHALLFMSGNAGAIKAYDAAVQPSIKALRDAVDELGRRNEGTTQRSVALGQALDGIGARADALAKQLDTTRGQTRQLTESFDNAAGAGTHYRETLNEVATRERDAAVAVYATAQAIRFKKEQYDAATDAALAETKAYLAMQALVRNGLSGLSLPAPVSLTAPKFLSLRDIASPGGPDDPYLGMPKATPSGEFIKSVSQTWTKFFQSDLPNVIMQAAQGGGNAGQAIGASVGAKYAKDLTDSLTDHMADAAKSGTGFLSTGFGKFIGNGLNMAIPVIGPLLGQFAGKVMDKLVSFFNGGEGHKANQLRDSLKAQLTDAISGLENDPAVQAAMQRFNTAGTQKNVQAAFDDAKNAADAVHAAMDRYGLSLDDVKSATDKAAGASKQLVDDFKLLAQNGFSVETITAGATDKLNALIGAALDSKTKLPAALQPYLDQLAKSGGLTDDLKRKILGLADPVPWQDMESAAQSLGIDVKNLGDKFNTAKWTSVVSDTADKFKLLTDNGTDASVIIAGIDTNTNGVKDAIEGLVSSSLKFKTEIPANAKPLIEAMMKAGELVDDNGDKLTDLSQLTFSKDLSQQFDDLISKLDELIDKIAGPNGVGAALGSTFSPEQMANYQSTMGDLSKGSWAGNQWVPGNGWVPDVVKAHRGAMVLADRIKRYHAGAARVIPFPTLSADEFPAILQSGEAVLNRQAVQAVGEPAIAAMNTGQGGGKVIQLHSRPTINIYGSNMSSAQISRAVGTALEKNQEALLTRAKRVING